MITHNICFRGEIRRIFTWYPLLPRPEYDCAATVESSIAFLTHLLDKAHIFLFTLNSLHYITQHTIWGVIKHNWLTHFHLWQKPARLNRFSENYHPGSCHGTFPSHVNYLATSPMPDWTSSQSTITRAHFGLFRDHVIKLLLFIIKAIKENSAF